MFHRVFKRVFSEKLYIFWAALVAFGMLALVVTTSQWQLIAATESPWIFLQLLIALPVSLGVTEFLYLLFLSVVFGINIAMAIYYYRHAGKVHSSGVWGVIVSLVGLGCSACGSLVLAPLLGITGVGVLSALPLAGLEFDIFGVALLIWSFYLLVKKLDNPYK